MEIITAKFNSFCYWYIFLFRRPIPSNSAFRGKYGEWLALKFLKNKNYRPIALNWRSRFNRRLELDIVCLDGSCLVFVEVRTRSASSLSWGWESFNRSKRKTFKRASLLFLSESNSEFFNFRHDFVEVDIYVPKFSQFKVRHHENIAIS